MDSHQAQEKHVVQLLFIIDSYYFLTKMENTNNTTFVKVTNLTIYNKLLEIEQHVLKTNGAVKLNKWVASTALSLVIISLGILFNHMEKII